MSESAKCQACLREFHLAELTSEVVLRTDPNDPKKGDKALICDACRKPLTWRALHSFHKVYHDEVVSVPEFCKLHEIQFEAYDTGTVPMEEPISRAFQTAILLRMQARKKAEASHVPVGKVLLGVWIAACVLLYLLQWWLLLAVTVLIGLGGLVFKLVSDYAERKMPKPDSGSEVFYDHQ